MVWPTLAHTVGTSSLSVLILSCCLYYQRVHNSEVSARRELTVFSVLLLASGYLGYVDTVLQSFAFGRHKNRTG